MKTDKQKNRKKSVKLLIAGILSFAAFLMLSGHTSFLKLDCYYLVPHTESSLFLYNGDFISSENAISPDRMVNVTIYTPDGWMHPPHTAWRESENKSVLDFKTGSAGTYVAGVSTSYNSLSMSAEDFNDYLVHDGVLNILQRREHDGISKKPATERYAKHVKAVFQVGDDYTDQYLTPLGFTVEFIPMYNPYLMHEGDTLAVELQVYGEPMGDQWVYAGYETPDGDVKEVFKGRTDYKGMVEIPLEKAAKWYIRTIYMTTSIEPGTDYDSDWATLSFEIY